MQGSLLMFLVTWAHVALAVFLIIFVLLQDSKGGALGALGTGGSQSVFGGAGAGGFLAQVTKWLAIFFAVTCLSLNWYIANKGTTSVFDTVPTTSSSPMPGADTGTAGAAEAGEAAAPQQTGVGLQEEAEPRAKEEPAQGSP